MRIRRRALAILASMLCGVGTAQADNDFVVYSPYVVEGQSEVELSGFDNRDTRAAQNGVSGYNLSVAHAVNGWWKPELYLAQFNRAPGTALRASGYEFENTFQLTERGEYWADAGLLAAYVQSRLPDLPSRAEFGLLLEKWVGRIDQRLNLIAEKPAGGAYALRSAYSVSYKIRTDSGVVSPGLEVYFRPADNSYQIGPVLYGEVGTGGGREFEYSIGFVNRINSAAADKTLLLRIGYEFF